MVADGKNRHFVRPGCDSPLSPRKFLSWEEPVVLLAVMSIQLDAKDVEDITLRAIAHLRIHVERVIGSLHNKYTLLHNTLPIRLLLPCKDE